MDALRELEEERNEKHKFKEGIEEALKTLISAVGGDGPNLVKNFLNVDSDDSFLNLERFRDASLDPDRDSEQWLHAVEFIKSLVGNNADYYNDLALDNTLNIGGLALKRFDEAEAIVDESNLENVQQKKSKYLSAAACLLLGDPRPENYNAIMQDLIRLHGVEKSLPRTREWQDNIIRELNNSPDSAFTKAMMRATQNVIKIEEHSLQNAVTEIYGGEASIPKNFNVVTNFLNAKHQERPSVNGAIAILYGNVNSITELARGRAGDTNRLRAIQKAYKEDELACILYAGTEAEYTLAKTQWEALNVPEIRFQEAIVGLLPGYDEKLRGLVSVLSDKVCVTGVEVEKVKSATEDPNGNTVNLAIGCLQVQELASQDESTYTKPISASLGEERLMGLVADYFILGKIAELEEAKKQLRICLMPLTVLKTAEQIRDEALALAKTTINSDDIVAPAAGYIIQPVSYQEESVMRKIEGGESTFKMLPGKKVISVPSAQSKFNSEDNTPIFRVFETLYKKHKGMPVLESEISSAREFLRGKGINAEGVGLDRIIQNIQITSEFFSRDMVVNPNGIVKVTGDVTPKKCYEVLVLANKPSGVFKGVSATSIVDYKKTKGGK